MIKPLQISHFPVTVMTIHHLKVEATAQMCILQIAYLISQCSKMARKRGLLRINSSKYPRQKSLGILLPFSKNKDIPNSSTTQY